MLGRKGLSVVPESPDGYALTIPEGLDPDIKVTPESKAAYTAIAHKLNLTNEQADGINAHMLGLINTAVVNQRQAEQAAAESAKTELRKEWGENYAKNENLVVKTLIKMGGEQVIDEMGGVDGLGNKPRVLNALAKAFSLFSEDTISGIISQGPAGSVADGDTQSALAKINEMNNNTEGAAYKALHDIEHPDHDQVLAERDRLYRIAYGS